MANLPQDYDSVMSRKQEVMKDAIGIDYSQFESGSMAFDYEKMMRETGYTLEEMQKIQYSVNVGNTPILELRNLTALARACAPEGKAPASSSRMKPPTHREALKPEERPTPSFTRKSWATRA